MGKEAPIPSSKIGSGPCPTTAPASCSARGSRKAYLLPPPSVHHTYSCSPTRAWNISTHRAASATGPVPSVRLPEMEAVDCTSLSCSLSIKNMMRIGRVTVALYFGISEVHIQRARFLAFSCLVSIGLDILESEPDKYIITIYPFTKKGKYSLYYRRGDDST